jgi:bifunctional DNA-binding transcriptional regulator/antitoxin component of YhaV-PrlF toxin-antitoxin module
LRRHLDVEAGDELLALVDDDAVRLVSQRAAIRQARGVLRAGGDRGSLAAELIAERRDDAGTETAA